MSVDDPAQVPDVSRGRGSIRVLHVDDDLVELAADALERSSEALRVQTETSVDDALTRLETDDVDCVVSDYEMPGRDGLEFLRVVRECDPDLPFILFTGKGSEEIASEAISAGVTDYLQKERGLDQYAVLANRIENAVSKHGAERMVRRAYGAMDTAREGIALLDEDGYFRYVNQAYAGITGYERGALIGEHWELLYPDAHVDRIYDEILPAVPRDGRWSGRTVYERADGDHIVTSHALAYADDGSLICLVRDCDDDRDVDDFETVAADEDERTTSAADGILDDALDALGDVFYVLDTEGNVVYVNEPKVTGYDRAEIESMDSTELFDPADCERVVEGIRHALETGSDERELRLRTEVGGRRTYEFCSWTLTDADGEPSHVVGIGRDVSGRKDRERALNGLHRTTRDLMRADSTAEIAELTVEALADILTLTQAGVHYHSERETALVPAAWTSEVEDVIGEPPDLGPGSIAWEAFETGEVKHYEDLGNADDLHNESTVLGSELIVPLGDHGVVIVAAVEADAFDENDRRLVQLLCENVTAAIERITHETVLRKREVELERENERLDEFASLVSHDLRNPLNVASGRLELARGTCESTHIDEAIQALERMETLVDDVLKLAREGEAVDETEPVALSTVVERCWANVETDGVTLDRVDEATIAADRSRLAQVFENLFRNSVEHGSTSNRTESGDAVEHGSTGPRSQAPEDSVEHGSRDDRSESSHEDFLEVTVGTITDAADEVRGFYVEDDGVGIDPDEREQVFEAGYSTGDGGTGFGLRIVEDIVRAHGWTIECTDGAAGGVRFEITGVVAR
ncbi:PAS domain S-box protein [Haloplanus rubicundus]|uniref:histidine kinase n=1 Tax=Haloplanus rubicundus TaxID=1547898 RepID=A0A345E1X0_9EURY|nr:PAS domain S-box protein [Haloplanus rubicundus]AXG06192.1 PAS domain S-box protein [Haloplanus rubicundus]